MIRSNGASSDSRVSIDEFEFKQTSTEGGSSQTRDTAIGVKSISGRREKELSE
jgi:hypothetical protein